MPKHKVKISVKDWVQIGSALHKSDPAGFDKEAASCGLMKEGAWWNPFSWGGGKTYDEMDLSRKGKLDMNRENQERLMKLHDFLQANPNLEEIVPRIAEVKSDIQKAVAFTQKQRQYMGYKEPVSPEQQKAEEEAQYAAWAKRHAAEEKNKQYDEDAAAWATTDTTRPSQMIAKEVAKAPQAAQAARVPIAATR